MCSIFGMLLNDPKRWVLIIPMISSVCRLFVVAATEEVRIMYSLFNSVLYKLSLKMGVLWTDERLTFIAKDN
jgi:hypothetical protein